MRRRRGRRRGRRRRGRRRRGCTDCDKDRRVEGNGHLRALLHRYAEHGGQGSQRLGGLCFRGRHESGGVCRGAHHVQLQVHARRRHGQASVALGGVARELRLERRLDPRPRHLVKVADVPAHLVGDADLGARDRGPSLARHQGRWWWQRRRRDGGGGEGGGGLGVGGDGGQVWQRRDGGMIGADW